MKIRLRIDNSTFFRELAKNSIPYSLKDIQEVEYISSNDTIIEITNSESTSIAEIENFYNMKYDRKKAVLTKTELEIAQLKQENRYLGQMITELELSIINMQSAK